MTDWQLIQRIRSGDKNVFKEVVRQHESLVASVIKNMLGHSPVAEDLGQETFIRFYVALDRFRGESSIGTYLTRIAINLCLNEIRRNKKRKTISLQEHEDLYDETKTRHHDGFGNKDLLHYALQQVKPKFRAVVVLRLINGYSIQETAKILRISEGTVRSRLTRARKKLVQLLSPHYGRVYNEKERKV